MKIAVIGFSGSGKSTAARALGQKYGIEVLHLDRVHHMPGWQVRPLEEKRALVRQFLDEHKAVGWVIDGNYSALYWEERMQEADLILFMNFGRVPCLLRAVRRFWRYRGHTRADMGEGCKEKLDPTFVRWILWNSRTRAKTEKFRQVLVQYAEKVRVIKNQKELDEFYREMGIRAMQIDAG